MELAEREDVKSRISSTDMEYSTLHGGHGPLDAAPGRHHLGAVAIWEFEDDHGDWASRSADACGKLESARGMETTS